MRIEYVLTHCDECDAENKYNWSITVKKGFSLTLCERCMENLIEKIADTLEEE